MRPRPPRSTLDRSSAASDVYKRQAFFAGAFAAGLAAFFAGFAAFLAGALAAGFAAALLSLIHISEPTRPY